MDEVDDLAEHGEGDHLFSRTATENAEVVPPHEQRTADTMWTVSANRPVTPVEPGTFASPTVTRSSQEDDPSFPPFPPPPFGRPYRSPIGSRIRNGDPDPVTAQDLWRETSIADDEPSQSDWFGTADPVEQSEAGTESGFANLGQSWSDEPTFSDEQDVPDEQVFSDEQLWSEEKTWSEEPQSDSARTHEERAQDGKADEQRPGWQTWSDPHDSVGSVFRADPVDRSEDVIEFLDEDEERDPPLDPSARSLFSNGEARTPGEVFGTEESQSLPDEPNLWQQGRRRGQFSSTTFSNHDVPSDEDSPGFNSAIGRLSIQERDRAAIPLLIAGAMLSEGEEVLGLVAGQMLGRPAVIVLSSHRVLVINDRRWQPVVDVYALDPNLEVRGRHDRNVAAVGVSDGDALSMVDGIFDVQGAMNLVARMRAIIDDNQ